MSAARLLTLLISTEMEKIEKHKVRMIPSVMV